jgi:hypothetical protein
MSYSEDMRIGKVAGFRHFRLGSMLLKKGS